MTNFYKISIFTSFFGLWIISMLNENIQIILGFFLIFSFGIVHGANDLLIYQKIKGLKDLEKYKLLVYYFISILITILFYTKYPTASIVLFVLVSAYHFGEQHWNKFTLDVKINKIFFLNYGVFIFYLLFYFHQSQVNDIVDNMTNNNSASLYIVKTFYISAITLILFFIYFGYKNLEFRKNIFIETFNLIIFSVIFKLGNLILGFSIYFIFWHSIPSIISQIEFIYGKYSHTNFKSYTKKALLYWLISVISIVAVYTLFKEIKFFESIFFIFLTGITFPHAWLMLNFLNKKS